MADKRLSLSDLYVPLSTEALAASRRIDALVAAHRGDIERLAGAANDFVMVIQNTALHIGSVSTDLRLQFDPDLLRQIGEIAGGVQVLAKVVEAGWLPHYTSPQLTWQGALDAEMVTQAYDAHYRQQWPTVREQFRHLVLDLDIDNEAKATFEEALSAHENGLYRSTVRLIFPELERVARVELFDDSLEHPLTSQRRLRTEVLSLSSDDVRPGGFALGALAEKLTEHIYEEARTEEARAVFRASAIPNRHAALHGVVSYRSHQSSINALIIADFSLQVIAAVKRARDAGQPAN